MTQLTITRPDDWHVHLRDNIYLTTTVPATAKIFARALVMPNLKPPVTTIEEATSYRERILAAIPPGIKFQPLMTLYLTETTSPILINKIKQSNLIFALKLYPAGATTHSAAGVKDITKIYAVLAAMQEEDLPLCIHAETTADEVDIFDREKFFLEKIVTPLLKHFPKLRIVIEHISSEYSVNWIKSAPKNIAATITAHHLFLNRNDLLVGGLHPHYYCLPIVKTEKDREALIAAATSGNRKFFLGTDSAPHTKSLKESANCSAGIFTASAAIELYAEIFEEAKALDKLEGFASFYGADFYQLPRNKEKITLIKDDWMMPATLSYGDDLLIPFGASEIISWKTK